MKAMKELYSFYEYNELITRYKKKVKRKGPEVSTSNVILSRSMVYLL
jgi:hypothetical protein